jgi:hypothetical protein
MSTRNLPEVLETFITYKVDLAVTTCISDSGVLCSNLGWNTD